MQLRHYQERSADFLANRLRGFVIAPAGSGKTVIGANAVARRAWPGCRVVWLANTREQVQQAEAAISCTEGPDGVSFEVCCVASNPDTARADIVVVDEAHHMPAETWKATIERIKDGAILWGLSATPWSDSDKDRDELLRATFREFITIEREEVLASGHLVPGKVFMHDLDVSGQFDTDIDTRVMSELRYRCARFPTVPAFEHERRIRYQITQEVIQQNAGRNACIQHLARSGVADGHAVLLLVFSIEHGQLLADGIPGAQLCYSKLTKKRRAAMIEGFRTGFVPCLVATSLADEGLDVPRASVLVLAAGGRSAAKLEQRAGRVLRPYVGKEGGTIHDFLDRGAKFAHAQANARVRVYSRLGYEPEVVQPRSSAAA